MFGFLEFEEDPEALGALLDAAAAWLRERGRDRMVGPMDFTMNDESGVLIDGFERRPMLRQPWHPPYYQRLCEEAGLEKAVDLFMWTLDISGRDKVMPIIWELAEQLEPKHGITIRKMTRRGLRRDLDAFAEIYNEAWSRNWGFVPYEKADLDAYAEGLHLVFDRDWFMVAENAEGKTVGVAITVPDVNEVLAKMNGRILPFGWWHYLNRRRIVEHCRVGFLGVKPAWQHTGVAAGLYAEHFDDGGSLADPRGRDGLDPRDQQGDEPRHGGDGRGNRQALPGLRAGARRGPRRGRGVVRLHSPACPSRTPFRIPSQHQDEVRPLPVLAEPRPIERRREVSLPAAVAAATGGFLLGVATFVLVKILRRSRPARTRIGSGRGRGKRVDVAASRSFLVDIHLLKDR